MQAVSQKGARAQARGASRSARLTVVAQVRPAMH
jgi:hypothetical protein